MLKPVSAALPWAFTLTAMLATSNTLAQGTPIGIELLPLGKDIGVAEGQTVTPAYEGWYVDDDGRIALSFGYYNRNTRETPDIPIGPANRIIGAPDGNPDQGQPTHFETGRQWGVFTVKIPADSQQPVAWHLENQGKTFHIAANRKPEYIIDAIAGDASRNFPPQIWFTEGGPKGHGPGGITTGPLQARVGQPLRLDAWVGDDGVGSALAAMFLGGNEGKPPVTVAWFRSQGPGEVEFSEPTAKVPVEGGKASTEATFTRPGDYLLRVRVTEFTGPEAAGHAQCCWTNGFVKVHVSG